MTPKFIGRKDEHPSRGKFQHTAALGRCRFVFGKVNTTANHCAGMGRTFRCQVLLLSTGDRGSDPY